MDTTTDAPAIVQAVPAARPTPDQGSDHRPADLKGGHAATRSPGLLPGTGLVALFVLGIFAAYGEVFIDAAVVTTILLGVAYLAERRGRRWARWTLAGLMTVFIGVNLVYAVGDLAHPETWAPFTATVGLMGAATLTVVLAVRAALGRSGPGKGVWGALAGVVVVSLLGSLVAAASVVDAQALPSDVVITADDFAYPEAVTVDPAAEAVVVANADRGRHTFVIDGLVGPVEIPGSSQVRIPLDLGPGTYTYSCDIPGHEAMRGKLTVR